jgi:hypothetical protein
MNIEKEYQTVNEMLKFFGHTPIQVPTTGSARQKLEHLLDAYAEKLKIANPQYQMFRNNREIPEMLIQYIVGRIEKLK